MNELVGKNKLLKGTKKDVACVSGATFFFFLLYQLDFFLHLAARVPGLGVLRPTLVMFGIITLLLILQRDLLKERLGHPILKAMGAFLLMLLFTLPLVKFPGSVINENAITFLKAIVFLYFSALILDNERRLKISLFVFVVCQIFRVAEPLYLNITQGYWGDKTYLGDSEFANRLSGAPLDIINPNELGFVIVTAIPFLHYFLLPKNILIKVIYFSLIAMMLYALILTMSRGAFIALLVVAAFVFFESKRKILLIIIACFIAVAGWSVMNDNQRDRYFSLVSSDARQSGTADGRLDGMINEFKLGFERPIFGFGLGTTAEAKFNTWGRGKASHNMYAEILIETGIVGMIFFIKFILSIKKQLAYSLSLRKSESVFYTSLFKVMNIVFWMFALYSLNYWGLSQYYWYNFAGIVVAAAFLSGTCIKNGNIR